MCSSHVVMGFPVEKCKKIIKNKLKLRSFFSYNFPIFKQSKLFRLFLFFVRNNQKVDKTNLNKFSPIKGNNFLVDVNVTGQL